MSEWGICMNRCLKLTSDLLVPSQTALGISLITEQIFLQEISF
jgi:hypothetical protein